jgi:hypothetical protein
MDLAHYIANLKLLSYSGQARQSNGWIDPVFNLQTTAAKLDYDLAKLARIKRIDHTSLCR